MEVCELLRDRWVSDVGREVVDGLVVLFARLEDLQALREHAVVPSGFDGILFDPLQWHFEADGVTSSSSSAGYIILPCWLA